MKPMLAATLENVHQIRFPIYASPKLDGVRGVVIDGVLRSRSLKTFPNSHVQLMFSRKLLNGLDGELVVGAPNAKDVYRVTQSAVANTRGAPDVTFYVFDNFLADGTLAARLIKMEKLLAEADVEYGQTMPRVVVLEQREIKDAAALLKYEEEVLAKGYEGLILRSPHAFYKQGRSTLNEQGMLKLKRFTDGEATIIGMEEELANTNVAKTNALGRTERSTAQAGMVGKARMGAIIVRDVKSGVEFNIGTGFTMADRELFWANKAKVVGMTVKYKSFLIGVKDAPRFPVYLGMRNDWDMS